MVFANFVKINSELSQLYLQQKLHHAILFDGNEGIGKAAFASTFVRNILGTEMPHHPNLLLIDKGDKKEITIDKIRQIKDFVNKSAAANNNKFIIIDSACQMNRSATNALLKILEEPNPGNYIFLISHNLSRVLPTIRSRCHIIKVSPPSSDQFQKTIAQENSDITEEELQFLNSIFGESVALAISERENIIRLYKLFLQSFADEAISNDLLKLISNKDFNFALFVIVSEFFTNRLLKILSNCQIQLFFSEKEVFTKILQGASYNKLNKQIDDSLKLVNKTIALNLDRKATLVNIFNSFINVKTS